MSDRDRLAAIVKERLDASNVADQRWRTSMSGSIANALTAAKALIARELVHMVHVSDRDRLAELFRLHRFIPGRQGVVAECGCGAIEDLAVQDWHEHHCADAFLAVGVTMPEPEPEEC